MVDLGWGEWVARLRPQFSEPRALSQGDLFLIHALSTDTFKKNPVNCYLKGRNIYICRDSILFSPFVINSSKVPQKNKKSLTLKISLQ